MRKLLVYNILFLILLILPSRTLSAQELTNAESRKLNLMVLDVLDRYEDYGGVYDEDSEYEFIRLFESPDSPVYAGDLLLGYGLDETIPASEYASKMLDFTPNVSIRLSVVRKGEPYYDAGLWYVPITMRKSLEYTDGRLIISSDMFYNKPFDLTLLMACDLENERCRIASITGEIDSDIAFPLHYIVIRRPDESDAKLSLDNLITVGGKQLEYNSLDYALIPEGGIDSFEPKEMKHEIRMSEIVVDSTFRHKELEFDFKKTRGRFKIRNKVAPFYAFELTEAPSGISYKSWAYELGFDLGFGAPVGKTGATRFGLFFGAAANYSNMTLISKPFQYNYTLSAEQGGYSGNLATSKTNYNFKINSVTESVTFLDLMVPVYMSFDHRFGRKGWVWLNWNIGVKGYLNMNSLLGWNKSSYMVDGQVTITDNLTSRVIQSKNLSDTYNEFLNPTSYPKSLLEFSATANVALHIRLSRSAFLTMGAGYELGLTDSNLSSTKQYYLDGSVYPFVTDASYTVVPLHTMYESVSFRRRALWLDLGFMFKF